MKSRVAQTDIAAIKKYWAEKYYFKTYGKLPEKGYTDKVGRELLRWLFLLGMSARSAS